jgi:hypothetical protein
MITIKINHRPFVRCFLERIQNCLEISLQGLSSIVQAHQKKYLEGLDEDISLRDALLYLYHEAEAL